MAKFTATRPLSRGAFTASMSLALLAVAATVAAPDRSEGLTLLFWVAVFIPAFLLAYFRGLGDAAVIIATSMVAITLLGVVDTAGGGTGVTGSSRVVWLAAVVAILMPALVEMRFREVRRRGDADLVDRNVGLPNRAFFEMSVDRAFAASQRGAHPVVVVRFNIDNITGINRRLGGTAGDAVIRAFADALRREVRREDVAAHFEGDSYVALMANSSPAAAEVFARRVMTRFGHSVFAWGASTACAGIAVFHKSMTVLAHLVDEAERAVRRAKAVGPNEIALPLDDAQVDAIRRESLRITSDHVSVAQFAALTGVRRPSGAAASLDDPGKDDGLVS